jgi:outer membrane protein TolC
MMMGLVAKNAILLVDKANEARQQGATLFNALIEAGSTRLRPILMTTLAMVIGMLPLALAKGAGAELNSGLAWVLIGGLSSSMFLTLVVVPVIYYIFTRVMEKIKERRNKNRLTAVHVNTVSKIATTTTIIVFILLISTTAQAQPQKLSLKEAIDKGLAGNAQIKLAQLEETKAAYSTKEAQSNLYPNIAANGIYNRNIKAPVFFFPQFGVDPSGGFTIDDKNLVPVKAASKNTYSAAATLSMPIWNKEINAGIKTAKLNEQLAKANTLISKVQLTDEITKAYYNALISNNGKELVEQSVKRAGIALASAKSLHQQGIGLDADTLAAFVNLETLKLNRFKSSNTILQAGNYLKYLSGISLDTEIELTDDLTTGELMVEPLGVSLKTAADNRPEIIQNKITKETAIAQLQVEKSRYYPNFNFISQYQIQSQANDFKLKNYTWPNSLFAGLQINIPIFSGFKNNIKVKQGKLSIEQVNIQQQQLTEQISLEVRNTYQALKETYSIWKDESNIIPSAERNFQLINSRWQKGVAKYNEVADAELMLIQAKNNQLQAAYNYLMAKAAYLKAINYK